MAKYLKVSKVRVAMFGLQVNGLQSNLQKQFGGREGKAEDPKMKNELTRDPEYENSSNFDSRDSFQCPFI